MLEKKCHPCVKEVKEIPFGTLIVDEFKFIVAEETSQP